MMRRSVDPSINRHRPPAQLVEALVSSDGETVCCRSDARRPWTWTQLLDAAAQVSGLCLACGAHTDYTPRLVAGYEQVVPPASPVNSPVRWTARVGRLLLDMHQIDVRGEDDDGRVVLEARVTLAPVAPA